MILLCACAPDNESQKDEIFFKLAGFAAKRRQTLGKNNFVVFLGLHHFPMKTRKSAVSQISHVTKTSWFNV